MADYIKIYKEVMGGGSSQRGKNKKINKLILGGKKCEILNTELKVERPPYIFNLRLNQSVKSHHLSKTN